MRYIDTKLQVQGCKEEDVVRNLGGIIGKYMRLCGVLRVGKEQVGVGIC
jgi:hypothetical protein